MIRALCTSCNAGIVWTVSEATGKRSPIDAEPVPNGNLRIVEQPPGPARPGGHVDRLPPTIRVAGATVDLLDPTDDGVRYVSHFATCPQAAEHRRRK